MTRYKQNQYVEIFDRLPTEIKDVVAASATTEHLWKIGQKHSLHIDKIGVMTDIAFDVIMGIVASKNFARELQNELQISAIDASVLARDIDENVFKPIKEIMVRTYGDVAPNKPSSSLVILVEDDEDHELLDKNALLREIENPTETVVKVEKTESVEIEKPKPVAVEPATMEIETVEEVAKLKELEQKTQPEHKGLEETKSAFDRLADIKLSQATIMPREMGSAPEVEKFATTEVKPTYEPKPAGTSSAPKPAPTPAPKPYTTDPYREPIS